MQAGLALCWWHWKYYCCQEFTAYMWIENRDICHVGIYIQADKYKRIDNINVHVSSLMILWYRWTYGISTIKCESHFSETLTYFISNLIHEKRSGRSGRKIPKISQRSVHGWRCYKKHTGKDWLKVL
jgi:hypothetical protein